VYHFVAELPRTSTNKVLRRVLREQALRKPQADAGFKTITTQATGIK
jgi:acyl-coenzyme A synthetase/AMP-(fatty) acid ligase